MVELVIAARCLWKLPAVHFLCKHSFHEHCLKREGTEVCPTCEPETGARPITLARQVSLAQKQQSFFKQVRSSSCISGGSTDVIGA